MKNNKLKNFEMCTLAIVGALQFMEQLRRAGQDLTRSAQKKEEKPKLVMKVGKIYQLANDSLACCYKKNSDGVYLMIGLYSGRKLWHREDGLCVMAEGAVGRREEFNVRRTWKKKYEKQKDVE